MFIADAHCDTLYAIAIDGKRPEECVVTPSRMAAGGVGLQTFALFAGRKGTQGTPYADGVAMLGAVPKLGVKVLTGDLPQNPPQSPTGIISCEGGEMLEGSIARLDEFQSKARLRMIALTWNFENEIGHPAKEGPKGGLKPFGFELLQAMDAYGILADTSHLNEAGFWDVCEKAELPPIASHSDCRWLCDVPRNLRKEQVKALIDRGGFIGVNFYSHFLKQDGRATMDDVVRHLDALCELGAEHIIGFGSDFDGIEVWPEGLAHPGEFGNLLDALRRRGYGEQLLADMAGMNLWRLLKRAERAAS
ncbi:MAG: membrane dipeptidase [Clostridia bacterium]|nr:membrane dipeptidase [Clostridia bacterium]